MQTAKSQVNLLPASDIIRVLKNILAHSQVIMPDLSETPYSQPRLTTDYFAIQLKDQSTSDVVTLKCQQQLDVISPGILASLETTIDSVQNLHRQLIEHKAKIIESINSHNRLRSALWRLPTEILSLIFHHCLPEFDDLPPRPLDLEAPLLLTTICRRWREIAVHTPSLWCSLFVTANDHHWQRVAFCYDTFLKRSRGLPLSLELKCSENHSIKLQSLLQPYANQIFSLSIYCPSAQVLSQPELLFKDLPALRELTFHTIPDSAITECISQLPSTLHSLRFSRVIFGVDGLSHFAPVTVWTHLTEVEIYVDGLGAFHHLLLLCPNLSSLTTGITGIIFHEMQALIPFTHTKLEDLCVRGDFGFKSPLSRVFDALLLPNLRELDVSSCSPSVWPHDEFKAFLERSQCPLEAMYSGLGMTTAEHEAEYSALLKSFHASRSQVS